MPANIVCDDDGRIIEPFPIDQKGARLVLIDWLIDNDGDESLIAAVRWCCEMDKRPWQGPTDKVWWWISEAEEARYSFNALPKEWFCRLDVGRAHQRHRGTGYRTELAAYEALARAMQKAEAGAVLPSK